MIYTIDYLLSYTFKDLGYISLKLGVVLYYV